MNRKFSFAIFLLILMMIVTSCSNGGGSSSDGGKSPQPTEVKKKDPITLSILTAGVSKEEFDKRFRGALEKKFPYITLNYIVSGPGTTIQELIAQDKIPDIMRIDVPGMKAGYLDLGVAYGLDELIKKNKYDLNKFNNVFIKEIIDTGRTGELFGLPVPPYFPLVTYYNKDIFDKFGVAYPKDGMSWNEIYELAKKMTRADGSDMIRGFSSSVQTVLRDNPYSLSILDPNADQLTDPTKWKSMFENLLRFYQIPGNTIAANVTDETNAFSKGKVAMQVNQHNIYLVIPPEVNWDIVSVPALEGAPKVMGQRGPAYWAITKQSKYKDDAFAVITEMLSDEVQMSDSRNGIPTTLNNKDIMSQLGKDHPVYSKKNMNAVNFYPPSAPTQKRKKELVDVPGRTQEGFIWGGFFEVAQGKADINTTLNKVDEQLKKAVADEKNK